MCLKSVFPSRTCRERRQKMLKLQNLSIYLMVFEGFKPMIEPSQCTAISRCDKRCWPRGFTRSHHLHIVSEGHRLPASSQRVARVPGTPGVKGKGRPSTAQSFIWWWWWIRQLFQESCSREKSCRVTGGHAWENTQCLKLQLQCSALQKGMHNTVHVRAGTCSSCKAIDIHAEYILILLSLQRHPLAFASLWGLFCRSASRIILRRFGELYIIYNYIRM